MEVCWTPLYRFKFVEDQIKQVHTERKPCGFREPWRLFRSSKIGSRCHRAAMKNTRFMDDLGDQLLLTIGHHMDA